MKQRPQKKNFALMLFIVILMVGTSFSVIFYGFTDPSLKHKYNGISFASNGRVWLAKINGRQAAFSFLPEETLQVKVEGTLPDLKNRPEIDTTSDYNSRFNQSIALAQHQMGLTLFNYDIYLVPGFTENNTYNAPIIRCEDATSAVPVIYFTSSNETSLSVDGNCIIANAAAEQDIIKVKDRVVYEILGVIDG